MPGVAAGVVPASGLVAAPGVSLTVSVFGAAGTGLPSAGLVPAGVLVLATALLSPPSPPPFNWAATVFAALDTGPADDAGPGSKCAAAEGAGDDDDDAGGEADDADGCTVSDFDDGGALGGPLVWGLAADVDSLAATCWVLLWRVIASLRK